MSSRPTISADELWLEVGVASQMLRVRRGDALVADYGVSTASAGVGEREGSGQTPRGWHVVRAKIGAGQPLGAVFAGRRWTGEVYDAELGRRFPNRDWILTRILWLSGLERGRNRLGNVDTMRRYIYFHGCPDEVELGRPESKGCIRMRNRDIVELFDRIPVGTRVLIQEKE